MRHPLCVLFLATLALSTSACTFRPEALDLDGQDVEVVFIHSADIHSRLLPYDLDVGESDKALGLKQENAPFGGIARLSSIVRQERRVNERFAHVDTGDVFQGAPIFNVYGGEPEFKALSNMGIDVMAIGNHEFDNGAVHVVEKAVAFAQFPMLAANYTLDDPNSLGAAPTAKIAQPYTILQLKGLRVGVLGLGNLSALRGVFKGNNSLGITPLHTKELVQSYVDYLRPQVDLVVAVGHIGYHEDLEYIPRTEGLDIVFGGHLHIALNPPTVIQDCDISKLKRDRDRYVCNTAEKLRLRANACAAKEACDLKTGAEAAECKATCARQVAEACAQEESSSQYVRRRAELDRDIDELTRRGCAPRDVLLVHSSAFLKFVGRLAVTLRQCTRLEQQTVCAERDASGRCLRTAARQCVGRDNGRHDWEVVSNTFRLIPIDKTIPDDPKMLRMLEPYQLELNRQQLLDQVISFTSNRVRRYSSGSGDSPLGNLVADSMQTRSQVWADFAITNSLGIRSDIVTGPVDTEQMTNVFPFENSITVMYLSGYEVQELMDFITQRSTSRGCQSQAQVAGVTATLNCGGCPGNGDNKCARQTYNGEACAQRVTIGGSGRPCEKDADCAKDGSGNPTGEICTGQRHPEYPGKTRCWLPIECARSYKLATNDYIARGGSGFQVLERNTTQQDLKISLRQSAIDYMRAFPACGEQPAPSGLQFGATRSFVVNSSEESVLRGLEQSAQLGQYQQANDGVAALRKNLQTRLAASKTPAEKVGLSNYLACTDDCVGKTSGCNGLAFSQVKQCTTFRVTNKAQCEALGRVRAALRCITLPCINPQEDARLLRIFKDSSGSPDPYDPFPE